MSIDYILRLKLREEIKEVFTMSREYSRAIPQVTNPQLDAYIDAWYSNHENLIGVLSSQPDWSWKDLAIIRNKDFKSEIDFTKAFYLYRFLIYRPSHETLKQHAKQLPTAHAMCAPTVLPLREMMMELFEEVILDGLDLKKCRAGSPHNKPYVSALEADKYKKLFADNRPSYQRDDGTYVDKFEEVFGAKFGRLPEYYFDAIYKNRSFVNKNFALLDLTSKLEDADNYALFKLTFLRYLSLDKISNKTGNGVDKTMIISKLTDYYFRLISPLTYDNQFYSKNLSASNPFSFGSHENFKDFYEGTETLNGFIERGLNAIHLSRDFTIKNRTSSGSFYNSSTASYNQVLTMITENVHSTTIKEVYVLSVHPCDMLNASLGYGWSSCHSFSNIMPDNGVTYRGNGGVGGYHVGNFEFSAGNAMVYFIPSEFKEGVPLWKTPRIQRQWIWVNNSLTAMRQNYFYPGRPSDKDSIKRAQELRVYLQNLFASYNKTVGTSDWVLSTDVRESNLGGHSNGYNDPVIARTKVKGVDIEPIIYSNKLQMFNNPGVKWSGNAILPSSSVDFCRICNKPVLNHEHHVCSSCRSEFVKCEVTGELAHPSEMIKVSDKYLSYKAFLSKEELYKYCVDTDQLEEVYVAVNSATGLVYYHDPNHKEIGICKSSGNYYLKSILIDGYAPEFLPDSVGVSMEDILSRFKNGEIAFSFEVSSEADRVLKHLTESSDLKWKSGKMPSAYCPTSTDVVLYVQDNSLITVKKYRYSGAVLACSTIK